MQVKASSPCPQENLKYKRFFHGCDNLEDIKLIFKQGFRAEFSDEEGRWFRDGNLGIGTYLSCDWQTAFWFGNYLIQATLVKGTKIIDTSITSNRKVLSYLRREFGHEILEPRDPREILPKNKNLTLNEFVELLRYHFQEAWHSKASFNWSRTKFHKAYQHAEVVHKLSRRMLRHGFHGFGHPSSDNGILIIQPERIVPERVLIQDNSKQGPPLFSQLKLRDLAL